MAGNVFVHIVTYNSAQYIAKCLNSLLSQEGFTANQNLFISVTDNNSQDQTIEALKSFQESIAVHINPANLGFCGGHNQGVTQFLASECSYLFILNPDVRLDAQCLQKLRDSLELSSNVGSATPKLLRADKNLEPVTPHRIDAGGMVLTDSLRHFDRGSEGPDTFTKEEFVFGGTGAALFLTRGFVEAAIVDSSEYDAPVYEIYPALKDGAEKRKKLFDEAFFAYREDADLAWRGQNLGWRCLFVPDAIAYHKRVVLPENRSTLPVELNGMSVRNRFLLQINNYRFSPRSFIEGILFRNILVVLGVVLKEQGSLPYLKQVFCLWKRAMYRRECASRKAG